MLSRPESILLRIKSFWFYRVGRKKSLRSGETAAGAGCRKGFFCREILQRNPPSCLHRYSSRRKWESTSTWSLSRSLDIYSHHCIYYIAGTWRSETCTISGTPHISGAQSTGYCSRLSVNRMFSVSVCHNSTYENNSAHNHNNFSLAGALPRSEDNWQRIQDNRVLQSWWHSERMNKYNNKVMFYLLLCMIL